LIPLSLQNFGRINPARNFGKILPAGWRFFQNPVGLVPPARRSLYQTKNATAKRNFKLRFSFFESF